ncbi:MAG TPA: hypothetical protein VEU06_06570 [Micropepsaceae bacterium]|nr:hypothetical protein [Micropepsaceae bacterium]
MTGAYVRHALFTAFRVAKFDRGASEEFDHSFEGFFRSFFAALLSLPIAILLTVTQDRIVADLAANAGRSVAAAAPGMGFWLIEGGAYVVEWVALPLAMILIVKLLGASRRYVPFIIAYNWGSCLVYLVMTIPDIAYLLGITTLKSIAIVYYGAYAFIATYRWQMARETLQISGLNAAAIVILAALLDVTVDYGSDVLHRIIA